MRYSIIVILAAAAFLGAAAMNSHRFNPTAETPAADAAPVLPQRRASLPAPAPPRAVPAAADSITPLTLDMTIRRQGAGRDDVRRQTVTRTPWRVHVATDQGPEWLYERNPVDPRRASAYFINHAARSIVFHTESDLRNELGISGWDQVLTLGFDASVIAGSRSSAQVRNVGGVTFAKMTVQRGTGSYPVWWNAAQLLAADFSNTNGDGMTHVTIDRIRPTVDDQLLQRPDLRYPGYRSIDLADWLEEH